MPPIPKVLKEDLLETAFRITEEEGIDAVTSRNIAKRLGCSIQPVFSHFPTMKELRNSTFDYACRKWTKEIMAFADCEDFFAQVTKWVLNLARNKPNLFKLLYLSDRFHDEQMIDIIMKFDSNKKMLDYMQKLYALPLEVCKDIIMRSGLFLLGISTMICINHVPFTDDQVASLMSQTIKDMVNGAKK